MSRDFERAAAFARETIADLRQEARARQAAEPADHILPPDLHRSSVADDRVTHEVSFMVDGGIRVPIEACGEKCAEQVAALLRSDAHKRDVIVTRK